MGDVVYDFWLAPCSHFRVQANQSWFSAHQLPDGGPIVLSRFPHLSEDRWIRSASNLGDVCIRWHVYLLNWLRVIVHSITSAADANTSIQEERGTSHRTVPGRSLCQPSRLRVLFLGPSPLYHSTIPFGFLVARPLYWWLRPSKSAYRHGPAGS